MAFEKSGVLVQFSDGQSFFNDAQGVRLEICWVNNFVKTLQPGEVQLSPIIKFHPYELQLSKPAQVKIPHSALVFYSNGWDVKLKSSTLHGEKIVWKNEEQYEVHNNEVSFHADYLLSYVVVGASLCNDKPTKKRLQCAVFGGEGRVGANYTAYLYIFDDCEASLEVFSDRLCVNRKFPYSPCRTEGLEISGGGKGFQGQKLKGKTLVGEVWIIYGTTYYSAVNWLPV